GLARVLLARELLLDGSRVLPVPALVALGDRELRGRVTAPRDPEEVGPRVELLRPSGGDRTGVRRDARLLGCRRNRSAAPEGEDGDAERDERDRGDQEQPA